MSHVNGLLPKQVSRQPSGNRQGNILFEAGQSSFCASVATGIEPHEPGTRKLWIQADKPVVNAAGLYVEYGAVVRDLSGCISDLTSKRMSPGGKKTAQHCNIFKIAIWATAHQDLAPSFLYFEIFEIYDTGSALQKAKGRDTMANAIRIRAIQGLREGDSFSYKRLFTKVETESFGDMTRDYNPVHYEPRWAGIKGFRDLICHGLLVGSMICEFGGQVGWLATGMNFKYIKPVYFGDTVHCDVTINIIDENGRAEAEAFFTNQDGEQVCHAHLTGRVPLDEEREFLEHMINEGDPTNKLSNEEYT